MLPVEVEGPLAVSQITFCPARPSLSGFSGPWGRGKSHHHKITGCSNQLEGTRKTSCPPVILAMKIYTLPVRIFNPLLTASVFT